ncbi:hypothetical protein GWK47_034245 [Chionoecetes opilio]|uniref:Uncharacterized protein n=1 Tax=Chionoecetes opilio TaxID=41210 RepID=A0A8J4YGB2_CHIOP|nr:hypothetical protein GWK47_034245 [Chionoecetes opilio]
MQGQPESPKKMALCHAQSCLKPLSLRMRLSWGDRPRPLCHINQGVHHNHHTPKSSPPNNCIRPVKYPHKRRVTTTFNSAEIAWFFLVPLAILSFTSRTRGTGSMLNQRPTEIKRSPSVVDSSLSARNWRGFKGCGRGWS